MPEVQLFANFMPPVPSVLLSTLQDHQLVHLHCCSAGCCNLCAIYGQLYSKKKNHLQCPILRTRFIPQSCFPTWKTAVFFLRLVCPVTVLLEKENEYLYLQPLPFPLWGSEKHQSCIRTDSTEDKSSLFPLLQLPSCPSHCSCNLSSYLPYLSLFHTEKVIWEDL